MQEVATISFKEFETDDDAVAIVRRDDLSVAVCLSVRRNGDIEVVMKKDDARRLMEALHAAVA